jgi:hypothetical protein
VCQRITCTFAPYFGFLPETGACQRPLGNPGTLLPPFLQVPPLIDVNSLFQAQRELAKHVRTVQTAKMSLLLGLSGVLKTIQVNASANGMSVALFEGERVELLWHRVESRKRVFTPQKEASQESVR